MKSEYRQEGNLITKKHFIHVVLGSILVFILFSFIKSDAAVFTSKKSLAESSQEAFLEYMEDKSGALTIEQVKSEEFSKNFLPHDSTSLFFGYSHSTWWIKLKIRPDKAKYINQNMHISINNPLIEKIVLYVPENKTGKVSYSELKAGWGFQGETQDKGFMYPVFKLSQNVESSDTLYMKVQSPYAHNYDVRILSDAEFNEIKQKIILFLGVIFGILCSMALYNLILFVFLLDRTYIYYVAYIFAMILYQSVFSGVIRIFYRQLFILFVSKIVIIGMCILITSILFVRAFLKTREYMPRHDAALQLFIPLSVAEMVLMLTEWRVEANNISILIANALAILIFSAAIFSIRKGVRQAKYFLIAWSMMLFGSVVFAARSWGWIPNNFLTMYFFIFSAAVESILLSTALADRINSMRKEKEKTQEMFKSAEESCKAAQIAFLQAQINPHFLYNALNVIATLCRMDAEKARELILDLSTYLHHIFDYKHFSKYISFEEELEFIQAYVMIEKARFRERLKVEFEIDNTEELKLPPLILQPLVENAIRHGIRKKEQGGRIILRVKCKPQYYVIEVEDDGVGIPEEQLGKILSGHREGGTGIGIINIHKRLIELYGTGLHIGSQLGTGTKVTLIIPKGTDRGDERSI